MSFYQANAIKSSLAAAGLRTGIVGNMIAFIFDNPPINYNSIFNKPHIWQQKISNEEQQYLGSTLIPKLKAYIRSQSNSTEVNMITDAIGGIIIDLTLVINNYEKDPAGNLHTLEVNEKTIADYKNRIMQLAHMPGMASGMYPVYEILLYLCENILDTFDNLKTTAPKASQIPGK